MIPCTFPMYCIDIATLKHFEDIYVLNTRKHGIFEGHIYICGFAGNLPTTKLKSLKLS